MRVIVPMSLVLACAPALADAGCKPHQGGETSVSTSEGTSGASSGSSGTGLPSGCGDGEVAAPEVCDDGNSVDGDGCNSDCQISGSSVWCKAEIGDDGPGVSGGHSLAVDGEGNVIVVGLAFTTETQGVEAVAAKYSPAGELAWVRVLPGGGSAQGVVIRDDGSIVISSAAPLLFLVQSSGEIAGTIPLPGAFTLDTNSLVRSPAGVIAFAANTLDAEPHGVIGVLNDDLSLAWTRAIDEQDAKTEALAISHDLDGNWLLGGTVILETIDGGDWKQEIPGGIVRKYDRSGSVMWTQPVLSADDAIGVAITSVRTSAANEVVALGIYTVYPSISAPNMVLVTIGSDGQILEQLTLANSESSMFGRDLVLTATGDRIVTGMVWPVNQIPVAYAFTARYTSSGSLLWSSGNPLMSANSSDFSGLVAVTSGDLFATGVQAGPDAGQDRILVCRIRR